MTVAIVTGGSRGIGAAIVEQLASQGMSVACTATSLERAESVARSVGERHDVALLALEMRVEDAGQVRRSFAAVEESLGPITMLVNNAGVTNVAPIIEADLDALSHVVDVNLKGVLNCSHVAARLMVDSGVPGSIINIGSVGAVNGFPGRGAYAASKAGVHHLTKVLAIELAKYRIRVNCVAPGFVETDMVAELAATGVLDLTALKRRTPLGELIPVEEVAGVVAWLSSRAAAHITGETILVDGGWTAYGHL